MIDLQNCITGDTGILGMGEFNVKHGVCDASFDGTLMYVIASFALRLRPLE